MSKLLKSYPSAETIVTDKLASYNKPIKHKRLNNRVENVHQPRRRKEKCLIKFKSSKGAQNMLSLMGKVRNIFAVCVRLYTQKSADQKIAFAAVQAIWLEAAQLILHV